VTRTLTVLFHGQDLSQEGLAVVLVEYGAYEASSVSFLGKYLPFEPLSSWEQDQLQAPELLPCGNHPSHLNLEKRI
jgi:hypothetical protein